MNIFKEIYMNIRDFFSHNENDAHEFKPILAEIEENPINPLGPVIFWIIIAFILISALWMYFGKVDVVVTTRGTIIPAGEEKIVQALDKGVVSSVLVKEGDYVLKNQTLAVIIPNEEEPKLELNNLKEEEKIIYEKMAASNYQLSIAQEQKKRLEQVLDIIPQAKYDDAKNQVAILSHEVGQYRASLSEIQNRKEQIENQTQIIKSPVEGYVNTIFIHTLGGVVTPAEKLMTIVPKDAKMQIKAIVLNQDIGFVEKDMPVSIKVDTYNFQKYGLLTGVVTVVGANSIVDEKLGEVYEVYIKPQNTTLMVEGKEQSIKIGMTTTNEIKIGKRRIIEFFIYPLIKYLDESIKVR